MPISIHWYFLYRSATQFEVQYVARRYINFWSAVSQCGRKYRTLWNRSDTEENVLIMNLTVILSHLYKKNELLGNQYYYHVVREEQDYLLIKKIQRTCVTEKCSNFSFCVFNWLLKKKSMEFLSRLCLIWPKHLHEWIFVSRISCSGHSLIISTSYFSSLDFLLIMNLEGLKSNIFKKKIMSI